MDAGERCTVCALCNLVYNRDIKTELYGEDVLFMIVECLTCRVPMLVFKEHREWDEDELTLAREFANVLFPGCSVRMQRRQIPDHPHFHILLV